MRREPEFIFKSESIYDKFGRKRFFKGVTLNFEKTHNSTSKNYILTQDNVKEKLLKLKDFGCNLLHLCITWDDIEHEGPEQYDEDFLAQLRTALKQAEEFNLPVIIQPEMKGWSKATGGIGAPDWTLETAGIDIEKLKTCAEQKEQIIASKNELKLQDNPILAYATCTMQTLFWNSSNLALQTTFDGEKLQYFLQNSYIAAMKHTARRIKDCETVIGFAIMDTACSGFIGLSDLEKNSLPTKNNLLGFGWQLPYFECIKAASGLQIEYKKASTKIHTILQTQTPHIPAGIDIFKEGHCCPWINANLWHIDESGVPILDKPNYFQLNKNETFAEEFLKPFQEQFIEAFQKKYSHFVFLVQPDSLGHNTKWKAANDANKSAITAAEKEGGVLPEFDAQGHKILLSKCFFPQKRNPKKALNIENNNKESLFPPEILQYNLGSHQIKTERQLTTLCEQIASEIDTIHRESLSVILDGRGIEYSYNKNLAQNEIKILEKNFCKPYLMAINGVPTKIKFTPLPSPVFELEWESLPQPAETNTDYATEIFVPACVFPKGWKVQKFDGVGTLNCQSEEQRLYIATFTQQKCYLCIVATE
ncbi:MAG: hypothetical protein J6B81_03935 [Spirochaetaceae bacterium]|nr:hypothetical protein [Spirochaetaceae bacterium]